MMLRFTADIRFICVSDVLTILLSVFVPFVVL